MRVSVDGEELAEGWALGEKGVVAFEEAPAEGAAVSAGYRFDVPVRFAEDRLSLNRATFLAGEIPTRAADRGAGMRFLNRGYGTIFGDGRQVHSGHREIEGHWPCADRRSATISGRRRGAGAANWAQGRRDAGTAARAHSMLAGLSSATEVTRRRGIALDCGHGREMAALIAARDAGHGRRLIEVQDSGC